MRVASLARSNSDKSNRISQLFDQNATLRRKNRDLTRANDDQCRRYETDMAALNCQKGKVEEKLAKSAREVDEKDKDLH